MNKRRILGLFGDFDAAFAAINDIKAGNVPGVTLDDVEVLSPIEHPDIDEVLEHRKSHVPKFTLLGALFGMIAGFLFLASAQANFLVQPQGGKPVIPLPSNIVLTYEMLILSGVIFTIVSFMVTARLFRKRNPLYSEMITVDQVGVEITLDEGNLAGLKEVFTKHGVLEVREGVL